MTWLDRVATTPLFGFRFEPAIRSGISYLDTLQPLLTSWMDSGRGIDFSAKGIFDITIKRSDGFDYSITHNDITIAFRYKGRLMEMPGAQPKLVHQTPPQPFSSLIQELVNESKSLFELLLKTKKRRLNRIGIVAECRIDSEEAPPGIELALKHLASPWSTSVNRCNSSVTVNLNDRKGSFDRCHHKIIYSSEPEEPDQEDAGISLSLDWQRYFSPALEVSSKEMVTYLEQCKTEAIKYFDKFAMGDLSYGKD